MHTDKIQNLMVIVLDKNKRPLGFTSERRAKELLKKGKAVVHSIYPFVIRHKTKDARECDKHEFRIKIDPGSKGTGIAITDLNNNVYLKITILHRGQAIVSALESRSANRRNRRNRKTGYRRCKFKANQKSTTNRQDGWLPPSIMSIEQNIINWVKRLMKLINIVECSVEDVKLDMQKLENPDIKKWEYQHGTLEGITITQFLHNKYGYTCQYCGGKSKSKRIEVEHMISKANGGSNRIDNLTLACEECNKAKGKRNLVNWLDDLKSSTDELDQVRVKCISEFLDGKVIKPKNYGAWVNMYHKRLIEDLNQFGFRKIEISDGITTSANRIVQGYEKGNDKENYHYNDAICIGDIPDNFKDHTTVAYIIEAKGRGRRVKGQPNCCGILNKNGIHREKVYIVKDKKTNKITAMYQTGDICKISIPKGKYQGEYVARIKVRHKGQFDFVHKGKRISVNHKYCKVIHSNNGYDYSCRAAKGRIK